MAECENKDIYDIKKETLQVSLPDTVPGVGYSLKHRFCVEYLIRWYCSRAVGKKDGNGKVFTEKDLEIMLNRGKCHDMDKILTMLAYPQLTADYLHRLFQGHHEESMIEPEQKSKYDWIEMILDMESAKYTKPDRKIDSAYVFASECKKPIMKYLMPYFTLLDLVGDKEPISEIMTAVNHPYYEKDLVDAIITYIHTTHLHLLDGVSRIDDEGYMKKFNAPVPFRRTSTQYPGGTVHERPAPICSTSESLSKREFIHGEFEAELFDYDRICLIPKSDISKTNDRALDKVRQMGKKYQR